MVRMLVEAVRQGQESILPHHGYQPYEAENLKRAMSEVACPETVFSDASACLLESRATKDLLLLRGLFAHKILPFCLEKRWNGNYGPHFTRSPSTRLAVPYQAKGRPAEQSGFEHSDVAIVLTRLSYYYAGLTLENFREAVEDLLKQDDPAVEYDTWAVSAKLSQGQNTWNTINLDDGMQILTLLSPRRYNWNVINFFLNSFVFPRETTQFETKLASSGFDIPQTAQKTDSSTLCKSEAILFATQDHLHAVDSCASNDYHRAVHWLIWHKQSPDILLIISHYEAEKLLPELAKSTGAHLLTYAAPAARCMVHFFDLEFFSYPLLPIG